MRSPGAYLVPCEASTGGAKMECYAAREASREPGKRRVEGGRTKEPKRKCSISVTPEKRKFYAHFDENRCSPPRAPAKRPREGFRRGSTRSRRPSSTTPSG